MSLQVILVVFASCLVAQSTDWIAAGNRALDNGSPEEAASDFAHALEAEVHGGVSVNDLLHLRVTLATAYLEAGAYREAEAALQEAQRTAFQLIGGQAHAELLNAWSALDLKLGRLPAAEAELLEARRIVMQVPDPGELLPTVLHNLAAIEMRTGRYPEALDHEREAIRWWQQALTANHPTLIRGWASLASIQYMIGQPQEAKLSLEQALASVEKTYGPAHPLVADLLESDAIVLDKLKLKREARRARERAQTIRRKEAPAGADRLTRNVREALTPESGVYLRSK